MSTKTDDKKTKGPWRGKRLWERTCALIEHLSRRRSGPKEGADYQFVSQCAIIDEAVTAHARAQGLSEEEIAAATGDATPPGGAS